MQVGRVSFGNGALTAEGTGKPGAAATVLGGSAVVAALPWVLGIVGLIAALILISRMDGKK